MRLVAGLILVSTFASCVVLSGCVDPKHSRFANQGMCDVSTGSHICSTDSSGAHVTDGSDPSIYRQVGSLPGKQ